ncbi:MAG: ABC transporter permease [Anaerolineae bacterium]|nr:ABC transporter permease [Anaerolineae bacterium]
MARTHIINGALFPQPSKIAAEIQSVHTRELPERSLLLKHIEATTYRLVIASSIGILAGIVAGLVMGISPAIYRFFNPLMTALMPIPGIALAPLFIVWIGFGNPTIISLGGLAAFFPIAYNVTAGVRSVDPQLVRAATISGSTRLGIAFQVYLPWAMGYLLTGVKLGLARCWRTIIAVEFIAATNYGLGYMIWDAASYLRSGIVFGGIAILIVFYFVLEKGVLNLLEAQTIRRWGMVK